MPLPWAHAHRGQPLPQLVEDALTRELAEPLASVGNARRGEPQVMSVTRLTEQVHRDAEAHGGGRVRLESADRSFESAYRANCGALSAYFARRTRDPQEVADLTADTFAEALRSFASFDPARGPIRPWLFGIARRVFAKHCETVSGRREIAGSRLISHAIDADETDELLERIDAQREGAQLLRRLSGLSTVEREAVELVDLVGLTPREAGLALGVSSGALRVRLSRARARLRKEHVHV